MTNFKQRIERLKANLPNVERNPYAAATDAELLELADAVTADARQNPQSYQEAAGVRLLHEISRLNRGHAPLGETSHAT